ncbi:thiamine pyrophosphate-binding protein [Microbacterium sp. TNHR37B]|uniref:thiamine pyrophosphate-binding protein n=1 Tax=Microbacterium sp. TNHR37B TaxID=1775956 RepID=UPI0007B301D5|nr:thiamine pyrophosphate-binding protein [Microbacterium sp. TNHR37B]KZE89138.1 Acetolactate synthase isozyme 3 large subunit [Microbacterium sp. TNHR37B]
MSTVSAHVAQTLARHIDHVFGVMGNGNAHFLDALERSTDVAFTAVRHEAGGVVAADAYHRAGGGLAAATATYGAGFTNTLTALAEAVQAHVPLLLVVGDEPTSGPRPWDVDQIALASAVGARTYTVGRADAAATTAIAVEHALSYRVPTVLAIPYDVARLDAGAVPEAPAPILPGPLEPTAFARAAIADLADTLARARRPLLLAGRGAWVSGAGDALGRLADATGALTATTALGRGIFPRAEFDLGVAGGFGAEGAMELVRAADVAVVFGAGLNPFTMRFGDLFAPGTRVVQVDISPAATHPHVGGFIRGDAAIVAAALADALEPSQPSGWRESVDLSAARARHRGEALAPDGRLDPRAVAARIGEALERHPSTRDRVVVSDGGHFIGWANMYWPVAAPDRMMMVGTAYQSIGLGFPSVPGAALARPESTVVLTTGDGGGLMALADLESAVRVAAGRGLAVVWNDAAYGAEVNLYGLQGLAREPMLIPEVDFAGLARSVGAEGVVVRALDDLRALDDWAARPASDRPFLLLDCRISGEVIAPYQQEIIRVNTPGR